MLTPLGIKTVRSPLAQPQPSTNDPSKLGPYLVSGARALEASRDKHQIWPYNWIYPGARSKLVLAAGSIALPNFGAGNATIALSYQVPQGLRFSLLRVAVLPSRAWNWNEGSGDVFAVLAVSGSTSPGARAVEFLNNVLFPMGSYEEAYPMTGRLEFEPLDTLTWTVTNIAAPAGPPNFITCKIEGFTYPTSEDL